ncbi:MAG: hypothetical protein WCK27_09880 [Verrucomicrobiota bacterium]
MAAYADLGGLGTKLGPSVAFFWPMPNLVPLLLPWLAVLVLLALPSNRNPRAWWIWAPLIGLTLLGAGLQPPILLTDNEVLSVSVQVASAAGFGLTVLWLLGAALARRCRAVGIALAALAFAAVSLLAFLVGPASESLGDLSGLEPAVFLYRFSEAALVRQFADLSGLEPAVFLYLVLGWIVGGVVFAGALNLTGWSCRRRFSRVRVSLWLPLWLWLMWLAAGGLVNGVMRIVSGERFDWSGLLVAPVALALASFVTLLPFLILSFTNAFYRERLRHLLRLPAVVIPPPTPVPAAAVGPASR